MNHNNYRISYLPYPQTMHWKVEKRFFWLFWREVALFQTVSQAAQQLLIYSEMD